VRRTN